MTGLKTGGAQGYLRIAAEEAFITREVLAAYKRLITEGFDDPGFVIPSSSACRPPILRYSSRCS